MGDTSLSGMGVPSFSGCGSSFFSWLLFFHLSQGMSVPLISGMGVFCLCMGVPSLSGCGSFFFLRVAFVRAQGRVVKIIHMYRKV